MVVEPIEDLKAIEPEWIDLSNRTEAAGPFQHPAWLLPWWSAFGSGRLFSFRAKHGGQLSGLALSFLHEWQARRQITSSCLLRSRPPVCMRTEVQPQYVCSYIHLPASTAEFQRSLPTGLLRNLRRSRKQLDELGAVSFETSTKETFPHLLDSFFELHRARWAMKEDAGMIDRPQKERFHRDTATRLSEAGLARLHATRLTGMLWPSPTF